MFDSTESQGLGTDTFFCGPKQSPILSDEWLPRERRDKAHSVPFIPWVSSSWFLTPWFNHQTVFHLVHSSSWAENLCRHEILTVCLCLPPGKATLYPSWGFSAQWRLKVPRQKSRHVELHRRWRERTHLLPLVPSWLKVTLFDWLCAHVQVNMGLCVLVCMLAAVGNPQRCRAGVL